LRDKTFWRSKLSGDLYVDKILLTEEGIKQIEEI